MRTTQSPNSSAEICRQNNWQPGTLLEGQAMAEDRRHTVSVRIQITAIGERSILARLVSVANVVLHNAADEQMFDLHARDWEAV